jgi:hypothetical protein
MGSSHEVTMVVYLVYLALVSVTVVAIYVAVVAIYRSLYAELRLHGTPCAGANGRNY